MMKRFLSIVGIGVLFPSLAWAEDNSTHWLSDIEFTGFVAAEHRQFMGESQLLGQHQGRMNPSLVFEPEMYVENDENIVTLRLFGRLDSQDNERSHTDIRQFDWVHIQDDYELQVGIGKVFWGVIESRHLVDIVNQTDAVEDTDGEDKLGQPMIQYASFQDWGELRFFYLPYFREQTFVGKEGRLRGPLVVDESRARYTHSAQEWHPDIAFRYAHTIDEWDIGFSHFHGTSREATLRLDTEGALFPLYEIIDQTGIDIQYTKNAWLWKLEAIGRGGQGDYFGASSGGFEYTFFDVKETGTDVGVIVEYHRDARRFDAPATIFDNDLFVGSRIALNDAEDSEILGGVIIDLQDATQFMTFEASRRLSDNLKIEVDARLFSNVDQDQLIYSSRKDDFVQVRLSYYF